MGKTATLILLWNVLPFHFSFGKEFLRGIPASRTTLYDPLQDFTCFDGSLTIPFVYVNDDYCDCLDSSDEPGTSACPNGIFHCVNEGYTSLNIPASRVNDGICDCCDASDEYGTGNCTDVCEILGAAAKLQAERRAELLNQGNQIRMQLSSAGKNLKKQKQERLTALETEKGEAERLKEEADRLKTISETAENAALEVYRAKEEKEKELEAQNQKEEAYKEAVDAFQHLDSNQDGLLTVGEIQSRQTFDQNKDGEVSEEEIKFFFDAKTEATQEEFVETLWPRLKPLYMLEKGLFIPPEEKAKETPTEEVHREREDGEGDDEEPEEEWDKADDVSEKTDGVDHSSYSPKEPKYDEATQKLIDVANQARSTFESAQRAVQDLEREMLKIKDTLTKDYGPDDEFALLDGQCFTYTDREYSYKLCPFDQVVQMSKSGGSETRIGSWGNWGNDTGYKTMYYDKGQSCWNGPQRSTKVLLHCGLEHVVISASEPNKCEYFLEFQTPAACKPEDKIPDVHDEL